jgi:hypothetical protein
MNQNKSRLSKSTKTAHTSMTSGVTTYTLSSRASRRMMEGKGKKRGDSTLPSSTKYN